jgi:hypothetical protein
MVTPKLIKLEMKKGYYNWHQRNTESLENILKTYVPENGKSRSG